VSTVVERSRASSGRGWRWWVRVAAVAITVSAGITGLLLIGVTLAEKALG
jgi:hypothetical protein